MGFAKAVKYGTKLRMAMEGPAGAGKTMTALKVAKGLCPDGKIALIDTEHGSASKYADQFDFDTMELTNYSPDNYTAAINEAIVAACDVLIIDSLSHAWNGTGGAVELVDRAKDKFTGGWKDVTPMQNRMVETMLGAPMHVIATMRSKMDYILEEQERNGRRVQVPRKVGMAPVQRDGMAYEFDIVLTMDVDHVGTITKTRCADLDDMRFAKPGGELAEIMNAWLTGVPRPMTADEGKKKLVEQLKDVLTAAQIGAALRDMGIAYAIENHDAILTTLKGKANGRI